MSALDTNGIAKVCAAIDAGDGAVMLYDDEMRDVIDALDDRERAIGRERTRADAAEAEVARLRSLLDVTAREFVAAKASADGWREEATGLRAIVEGRTVAPTIKEARAHCHGAGRGAFVVTLGDTTHGGAHCHARMATGLQRFAEQPQRWIALDGEGRPCAWPVIA